MIQTNQITLNWKVIKNESINIDSIEFKNIAFIDIAIDNIKILNTPMFYGSFLIFDELMKSSQQSGNFLLFTSVNGIADDGGWELVKVAHSNDQIIWTLYVNESLISYKFKKDEYISECKNLNENKINLCKSITIEPEYVIFPE